MIKVNTNGGSFYLNPMAVQAVYEDPSADDSHSLIELSGPLYDGVVPRGGRRLRVKGRAEDLATFVTKATARMLAGRQPSSTDLGSQLWIDEP